MSQNRSSSFMSSASKFAATIAVAGLAGFGAASIGQSGNAQTLPFDRPQDCEAGDADCQIQAQRGGAPMSFANLVDRVSPAVVSISVEKEIGGSPFAGRGAPDGLREFFERFGDRFGEEFQERFEDRGPAPRARGQGSGFVIDADGFIVTNHHVVTGGADFTVVFKDGTERSAELIGSDAATDLALLKVDTDESLPYVNFAGTGDLRVGDWVLAVGNPFGLGGTVTAGIVSAFGRDIGAGPYTDYIQVDAPINRGNSGGPTFDLQGNVVGVNTAIFSPTGGSVGIGFAIPSDIAARVIDDLKDDGSVDRGWLGVQIQDLDEDLAQSLGLDAAKGALVASVIDDTPAEKAGIEQGDVILRINGNPVNDRRELTRAVGNVPAGTKANFTLWRDGREKTIEVRIARRDDEQIMAGMPREGGSSGDGGESLGANVAREFGLELRPTEDGTGALIEDVAPGSEAYEKGLRPGDVIVEVSGMDVTAPVEVNDALDRVRGDDKRTALFLVRSRNDTQRFVALRLPEND
jgi:serine protease Do